MLKAIHAQESKKASREKAKAVADQLREMKLKEAAKKVEDSVEETLTYCEFPYEHWTRIRTNNVIERLNREIRRRTRVVGTFPDGNSALMLVTAEIRRSIRSSVLGISLCTVPHLPASVCGVLKSAPGIFIIISNNHPGFNLLSITNSKRKVPPRFRGGTGALSALSQEVLLDIPELLAAYFMTVGTVSVPVNAESVISEPPIVTVTPVIVIP